MPTIMNHLRKLCITGALAILPAGQAMALSNPGFETGDFSNWQTIGQTGVFEQFKDAVNPTEGASQAIAFTNRFRTQNQNAAYPSLANNDFFGVDLNAVLPGLDLHDGSGFKQTLNVTEASTLTFDWSFAQRTSENSGNDIAFAVLNGVFHLLTDLTSAVFTYTGTHDFRFTDYSTFTALPELLPGEHTIAFGIVNVGTKTGRTALLIDNLALNPSQLGTGPGNDFPDNGGPSDEYNGEPVPEPVTAALTMLGVGALTVATRRRRPKP